MAKPALLKTSGRLLTCSSQVCPLISKTSEGFSHLPPTEKIKEYCFSYKTDFFFCRNYITHYIPFHSKYEVEKPFVELLIDQVFFFLPSSSPRPPPQEFRRGSFLRLSLATFLTSSSKTGWKVSSFIEAGVQQTWTDKQFNIDIFQHYNFFLYAYCLAKDGFR